MLRHFLKFISLSFLLLMFSACGKGSGEIKIEDNSTGNGSTLVATALLKTGDEECATGGVQIDTGIDVNANGQLDADEIDQVKILCNGDSGYNSLINILDEPQGENCAGGGKRIASGLDENRNDILDESEIIENQYVCNGVDGAQGEDGKDGANVCTATDNGDGTKTLNCNDGSSFTVSDGLDGEDGTSCSVADNRNGTATISCDDGTSATTIVGDKITATVFCNGTFENLQGVNWIYDVKQFQSGNILTRGAIYTSIIESSSTTIYSPAQGGFVSAPSFVTFDVLGTANYGWWRLELDRATLVVTITYNDLDLEENPTIWAVAPEACTRNVF